MSIELAVTNLGKYNEGNLVYAWLTLPASPEEIKACLDSIGINEEYEEFFNSVWECEIEGLEIGEYTSIEDLNTIAEAYEGLQDYEKDIISAIMEATSGNFEDSLEKLKQGDYQFYPDSSLEEVAEQRVDEGLFGEINDSIKNYIDYARIGRDLGYDGYTVTSKGVIRIN